MDMSSVDMEASASDRGMAADDVLAGALTAARLGVIVLDCDGRVVHVTEPASELLDRSASQLIGQSIAELVHVDDRGWIQMEFELLSAGASERIRREVRLVNAQRDEVWGELNVRRFCPPGGGPVCAVAILEDARDRPLREHELRRFAETDPLTALLNRRRFASELDRHVAWSARYGARGALLVLDIDGLKAINDTHGHLAGDQAITAAASVLRAHSRASDVVARLGGDEFAVLLPSAGVEQAAAVAISLIGAIASSVGNGPHAAITVSVGIAAVNESGDPADLCARADRAMYEVKRSGGNGYAIDPDHQVALRPAGVAPARPDDFTDPAHQA